MGSSDYKFSKALEGFYGANQGYVMELYDKYLQNPDSLDEEMRSFFKNFENLENANDEEIQEKTVKKTSSISSDSIAKSLAAARLAENIRSYGHMEAKIYPLQNARPKKDILYPDYYQLSEEVLKTLPSNLMCDDTILSFNNAQEAYLHLKEVYTNSIAFEFHHVHSSAEKNWLQHYVESGNLYRKMSNDKKVNLLRRLFEVEYFEKFLHRTFVGQKRFSIEGLDVMVPMMDAMIYEAVKNGAKTVNIGMAHRGRLNVLAHVLGKPYEKIFSEFQHAPNKELVPSEGSTGINYGWTGDVKYHLGRDRQIQEENTVKAKITLANNPSHLEFVGAVVEGYTRAAQDNRREPGYPQENLNAALALLIHGDAAFPGEGIVAETLNLSRLKGYRTGGTIHIISNNTIGFTTESEDSRSTLYASDLAKGFEIPIIHVNADDPEACIAAALLAIEYRSAFKKDFLIDLVGYRRYGHNEMDEPMTTSPQMYKKVNAHPTITELYSKKLMNEEVLDENNVKQLESEVTKQLEIALENIPGKNSDEVHVPEPPEEVEKYLPKIKTGVPFEKLKQMNEELLKWPEGFNVFPKLAKILKRREDVFQKHGPVEWALAEALAFGTILADGTPIRVSGQDSERGTFAQRNLVLHDSETGKLYSPLHHFTGANASFGIYNSPLTEAAVVGFEYGYNIYSPETLVIWEAQYGDFANAAQVLFDQFIAAGRAKWGQKSGMVILLPHGYEGQGPEHSSGRLERFLQSAAENNWTVANLTTSAQYFHILRRQASILTRDEVRPLIIMTPKSLLRNPSVSSNANDLEQGEFLPVIEQSGLGNAAEKVTRMVLCSGKIALELMERISAEPDNEWIHILRVEEIYPFPMEQLKTIFEKFPNVNEVFWIQEEPKNMGAWNFVEPRLQEISPPNVRVTYVGRRRRSSPAVGDPNVHKLEQNMIIQTALKKEEGGMGNARN